MGIAKRRLPLNAAPCCCWILHRSCVNKSWRDNARMWAKHPRWIFFQMTLSFRVLIGISCFFFFSTKLTCQLLRINMQNTCNLISKIQETEKCEALREVRGRRRVGVECFLCLSYGTVISPLLAVLFYPFWCEIGFRFNANVSPLIFSYKGFQEQRRAHRRCLSTTFVMNMW